MKTIELLKPGGWPAGWPAATVQLGAASGQLAAAKAARSYFSAPRKELVSRLARDRYQSYFHGRLRSN